MGHGSSRCNGSLFSASACTAQVCGERCPAKKQRRADEAELGAQWQLTLHQYRCYHTAKRLTCFRENVSSKSHTANYFYCLYSRTLNLYA